MFSGHHDQVMLFPSSTNIPGEMQDFTDHDSLWEYLMGNFRKSDMEQWT